MCWFVFGRIDELTLLYLVVVLGGCRYVTGIFVISTFAEVVSTIMDFQMKMLAQQSHPTGEAFSMFM